MVDSNTASLTRLRRFNERRAEFERRAAQREQVAQSPFANLESVFADLRAKAHVEAGKTFTPPADWNEAHVLVEFDEASETLRVRRHPAYSLCPQCGTKGVVEIRDELGYKAARECGICGPLEQRIERFNAAGFTAIRGEARPAGIPITPAGHVLHGTGGAVFHTPIDWSRFKDASGKPCGKAMQALITTYAKAPAGGLLFYGDLGMGKTMFANRLARIITLRHGLNCRSVRWRDVAQAIRSTYSQRDADPEDIVRPLRRTQLLVIDEIGATGTTLAQRGEGQANTDINGYLEDIMDARCDAGLHTILTTNLSVGGASDADSLSTKLGGRTADRIAGTCRIVSFRGESYRRKARG